MKIEEINSVSEVEEGDILFTSSLDNAYLVAMDDFVKHDWIIDSGTSFHVTPHKEWFTSYDAV